MYHLQMFTYLVIDSLIFTVPFLAYLIKKKQLTRFPVYLVSIALVSAIFIIWDYLATYRGHWSFSAEKVLGINIFVLPFEEILFFFVVGFSMLFVYDSLKVLVKTKVLNLKIIYRLLSLVLLLASFIFLRYEYTFIVVLFSSMMLFLATIFAKDLVYKNTYLYYLGIGFLLFLIFNFPLTWISVVNYGQRFILGLRITSIPVEDFFYNFLLLTSYVLAFEFVKSRYNLKSEKK